MRVTSTNIAALLAGLALMGLARAEEKAKEKEAAKTRSVTIGPIKYEAPTSWKAQQPRSTFRIAQFGVPLAEGDEGKVEIVVSAFGGQAGSIDANIDRWRGMFEDRKDEGDTKTFSVGDYEVTLYHVSGTYKDKPFPASPETTLRKNYRRLNAAVVTPNDGVYYFYMVGPEKSVKAQEEGWVTMFKSAKPN